MPSKVDERIDSLLADWSRATSPDTGGCRLHVGPSRLSRCRSVTHSACRLWWLPKPVLALIGTASAACTGCLCPLPPATAGTRSGTRGELVCPRHEGRSSGRGRVAAARPERGQRGNGSVSVDCTAGLECGGLGDSPAPLPLFPAVLPTRYPSSSSCSSYSSLPSASSSRRRIDCLGHTGIPLQWPSAGERRLGPRCFVELADNTPSLLVSKRRTPYACTWETFVCE